MTRNRVSDNQVVASSAAAVPARRKPASPKRVSRPAAVEVSDAPESKSQVPPIVPTAVVAMPAESHREAVARLAYSYWADRGSQGGSPEADWLRAEQELRAAYAAR